MGGRGAYFSGKSKDFAQREYDQIGTLNNGQIKVVQIRPGIDHQHFPTYSNTPNTTYFVVKPGDDTVINVIGIYRNHRLVESIDVLDKRGPHYHVWHPAKDRNGKEFMNKEKTDYFELKPEHAKLINIAKKWRDTR